MKHFTGFLLLLFLSAACSSKTEHQVPTDGGVHTLCDYDTDCDGVTDWDLENGGMLDNCISVANPDQVNSDTDLLGDACDPCDFDPANDADRDGDCGDVDNCPGNHNSDQANTDLDAFGNACDQTPTGDPHVATIEALAARVLAIENELEL